MTQGKSADEAARLMMQKHPEKVKKWLEGVMSFDGKNEALPLVEAALAK